MLNSVYSGLMHKVGLFISILVIVLASGCIDTRQPTISEPSVQISPPYNVNPNVLGMKIDANISVPITNIRNDRISIEILDATIAANLNDGTKLYTKGYANPISLDPQQIGNVIVYFTGILIKYELKENPLRLSPLISSYIVNVRYKGSVSLFGLIPYSKEDIYTKSIPVKEIPIGMDLFTQNLQIG